MFISSCKKNVEPQNEQIVVDTKLSIEEVAYKGLPGNLKS